MKNPKARIILVIAVFSILFLAFWLLFYLPAKSKMSRLKADLLLVQSQIRQIEVTATEGKSLEEGIKLLTERYRQAEERFPKKEEDSLRTLSNLARKLNITITSTRLQPKVLLLNENQQKMELEGRNCYKFVVTIEMKSAFKDLVRYMELLKESLPAYFTIDRLKIDKASAEAPFLNVALDVSLYLLF